MTLPHVAFAIPGDIETLTGGYIYERRLLEALRALGHRVDHIELPGSFPAPTADDMSTTIAALSRVPADRPLIVDGLVFGAAEGLETLSAPLVAMLHHPLAAEAGLPADRRDHLYRTERTNISLAAHVLVPSAHTRTCLIRDYGADPARVTIAPPGVDRPTKRRAAQTPPLVLSVGLLHPRKGHDVLLRALTALRELTWQCVIVGRDHDPDYARTLRAMCSDLDLDGRVRFAGEISRRDLEGLYMRATVFALATRYEGYGMVFAEALSHGLPIVATGGGAVPETIPEGAGVVLPVDDASSLAHALSKVLLDETHRRDLARASGRAGAALPEWTSTARLASGVLVGVSQGPDHHQRPSLP